MPQAPSQTPSIREALVLDAWEGHEDPLTAADIDAIAETTAQAASVIALDQFDAFLSSPNLDPTWIAGWHSAVKHVAAALAQQGQPQQ